MNFDKKHRLASAKAAQLVEKLTVELEALATNIGFKMVEDGLSDEEGQRLYRQKVADFYTHKEDNLPDILYVVDGGSGSVGLSTKPAPEGIFFANVKTKEDDDE